LHRSLVSLYCSLGFFACYPASMMLGSLLFISFAATVVESLPLNK
jgi:hypothetical protein